MPLSAIGEKWHVGRFVQRAVLRKQNDGVCLKTLDAPKAWLKG